MPSGIHSGKTAVVTGGARGIGAAIAARLAGDGAQVVITDIRSPAQEEIDRHRYKYVECDISSERNIARFSTTFFAEYERCDILINNAGIFASRPFEEITFAEWRRTFAVNLDAMFLLTRAL